MESEMAIDPLKAMKIRYEPYNFDAFKSLMEIAYRLGWYGGKQDLIKVTMLGGFEAFSGRSSETWEHKFCVEFKIPATESRPALVYFEKGETLQEACQKVLQQVREEMKK